MKPAILLRIASILMVVHLTGHTIGTFGWKKTPLPAKQEVIKQMTSLEFPFMGVNRSMGDYFEGFGWACSIAMLFFATVLWFVSDAGAESRLLVKKILGMLCLCLTIWSALEFAYFFPFAACTTLLSALFAGIAWRRLGQYRS